MSSSQLLVALGAVIRERRAYVGLSQEGLAETVGLHRTYIGAVERGERNVTTLNLAKIASGLDISASKLLGLAEDRIASRRRTS